MAWKLPRCCVQPKVKQYLSLEKNIPVILLTARREEIDRITGFQLGADDYVVKPFSPRELMMRVKAVLRAQYARGNIRR